MVPSNNTVKIKDDILKYYSVWPLVNSGYAAAIFNRGELLRYLEAVRHNFTMFRRVTL